MQSIGLAVDSRTDGWVYQIAASRANRNCDALAGPTSSPEALEVNKETRSRTHL
jgi:hypothetical protein